MLEGDRREAELLELVPLNTLSKSPQELANLSWLEPSADESSMMVQIIFKFGLSPSLVTPVQNEGVKTSSCRCKRRRGDVGKFDFVENELTQGTNPATNSVQQPLCLNICNMVDKE